MAALYRSAASKIVPYENRLSLGLYMWFRGYTSATASTLTVTGRGQASANKC